MRTAGLGDSAWIPTRGVLPIASRIDSWRPTRRPLPAGDRGEDRDHVAVGQLRVELLEVPDVVVVAVHVDELTERAGLVDELLRDARVALREVGEHRRHRPLGRGD